MATKRKRDQGKTSRSGQYSVRNLKPAKKLVHARLESPIYVRKTLLESAIYSTEILRSYQRLKKVRTQKQRLRTEMKKVIQDIKRLHEKLETVELPKTPEVPHLHTQKVVKEEIKTEEKKQRKQVKMLEKESGEDSIDKELKRMREKLRDL